MNAKKLKEFKNTVNTLIDTTFKEDESLLAIVQNGDKVTVAIKGKAVSIVYSLAHHALYDEDFHEVLKSAVAIVDREKQDAKKS